MGKLFPQTDNKKKAHITDDMTAKPVRRKQAMCSLLGNVNQIITFLKSQKKEVMGNNIKWNFTKFLIDRDGNVVARFAPTVTSEKIEEQIKELL